MTRAPRRGVSRALLAAATLAAAVAMSLAVLWRVGFAPGDVPSLVEDIAGRAALEPPYAATDDDFAALEDGIARAQELAPSLFPRGIDDIDVTLYDSTTLFVYSRRPGGEPARRWREYGVSTVTAWAPPTKRTMARCSGTEGFTNWMRARTATQTSSFFMCAPLGTFVALQRERRGSVYDTRESYLATVVHEFGHQYFARWRDELAVVPALAARVNALQPREDQRAWTLDEAWATWVELEAARAHFPSHAERLRTTFLPACAERDEIHCVGLRAALEVLGADAGAR